MLSVSHLNLPPVILRWLILVLIWRCCCVYAGVALEIYVMMLTVIVCWFDIGSPFVLSSFVGEVFVIPSVWYLSPSVCEVFVTPSVWCLSQSVGEVFVTPLVKCLSPSAHCSLFSVMPFPDCTHCSSIGLSS